MREKSENPHLSIPTKKMECLANLSKMVSFQNEAEKKKSEETNETIRTKMKRYNVMDKNQFN